MLQSDGNVSYTSEGNLCFLVYYKQYLADKAYILTLFDTQIILSEVTGDYKLNVDISLDNKIIWQTQQSGFSVTLEAFGITFQNKILHFYGSHENLLIFKNTISGKMMFVNYQDQYKMLSLIGIGSVGRVDQVLNQINQITYACKTVSKGSQYENTIQLNDILAQEIQMLIKVEHKHVVKFYEVYECELNYYLLFEYLEGGSLEDWFDRVPSFEFQHIQDIIRILLETVAFMHSKNIMHRDLKPQNIMFMEQNNTETLKIVDFGMATSSEVDQYILLSCGTPGYIAPEIANLKNNKKYGVICDLFSVGAVFYKMLTSKELFQGKDAKEIFHYNQRCLLMNLNQLSFNTPDPYATMDLIKKLLSPSVKDRITAEQALQHPFFTQQQKVEPKRILKFNGAFDDVEVPDDPFSAPVKSQGKKFHFINNVNSPQILKPQQYQQF